MTGTCLCRLAHCPPLPAPLLPVALAPRVASFSPHQAADKTQGSPELTFGGGPGSRGCIPPGSEAFRVCHILPDGWWKFLLRGLVWGFVENIVLIEVHCFLLLEETGGWITLWGGTLWVWSCRGLPNLSMEPKYEDRNVQTHHQWGDVLLSKAFLKTGKGSHQHVFSCPYSGYSTWLAGSQYPDQGWSWAPAVTEPNPNHEVTGNCLKAFLKWNLSPAFNKAKLQKTTSYWLSSFGAGLQMSTQSPRKRNAVSLIAVGEKNQHATSHHKTQLFSPELRNASALLFLLGFFLS